MINFNEVQAKWNSDGCPRKFNRGDKVVWTGQLPCIGIIKNVNKIQSNGKYFMYSTNTYSIDKNHSCLSEASLRSPTNEEIEILGKAHKILLPMTRAEIEEYIYFHNSYLIPIRKYAINHLYKCRKELLERGEWF